MRSRRSPPLRETDVLRRLFRETQRPQRTLAAGDRRPAGELCAILPRRARSSIATASPLGRRSPFAFSAANADLRSIPAGRRSPCRGVTAGSGQLAPICGATCTTHPRDRHIRTRAWPRSLV